MKLSSFAVGETALVVGVRAEKSLVERLSGLNVKEGSKVRVLRFAPFGGGVMLNAEGVRVALRLSLAEKIEAVPFREEEAL